MIRKQKRVYVDEVRWSAIKAEHGLSTDSDVMDHVMAIYEMADALKDIHPNLRTAIGKALAHNDLLKNVNVSAQVQVMIDGQKVSQNELMQTESAISGSGVAETLSTEPEQVDSNEDW